jgi:hypothetical protein
MWRLHMLPTHRVHNTRKTGRVIVPFEPLILAEFLAVYIHIYLYIVICELNWEEFWHQSIESDACVLSNMVKVKKHLVQYSTFQFWLFLFYYIWRLYKSTRLSDTSIGSVQH